MRCANNILSGNLKGRKQPGRLTDRQKDNIMLIIKKYGGRVWTGHIYLRIGSSHRCL
jgi:hypothetical protein